MSTRFRNGSHPSTDPNGRQRTIAITPNPPLIMPGLSSRLLSTHVLYHLSLHPSNMVLRVQVRGVESALFDGRVTGNEARLLGMRRPVRRTGPWFPAGWWDGRGGQPDAGPARA